MSDNIGSVLTKVQNDLSKLKENLESNCDQDGKVDAHFLKEALQKAEENLQSKADDVLQQMNNHVTVVPSLEEQLVGHFTRHDAGIVNPAIWDMRQNSQGQMQVRRTGPMGFMESRGMEGYARAFEGPELVQYMPLTSKDVGGPSPGDDYQQRLALRIATHPQNPLNRRIMHEKYGIQLPQIEDKRGNRVILDRNIVKGSNVERLAMLPHANRVDPQLAPPAITESVAKKGILSLLERGLIPPASEITLDPPPVRHKTAPIHDPSDKMRDRFPADGLEPGFDNTGYLLDTENIDRSGAQASKIQMPKTLSKRMPAALKQFEIPLEPLDVVEATPRDQQSVADGMDRRLQIAPPPTTPASQLSKTGAGNRFAIQNGKTRQESNDFILFKQHYCLSWGSIVTTLKLMENFLQKYSIPIAFINGDRLADLSIEYELEQKPGELDLLHCIVNRSDVEKLMRKPGRQFMGNQGVERAAVKIQASWRGYAARKDYLEYRKKKWAAGVIAIQWVLHMKMTNVKKKLKFNRWQQVEKYRKRYVSLAKNWSTIQTKRRVLIHLPSLGFQQKIRESIDDFAQQQNRQMSRLCDLKDDMVDIIYISPVPINDELLQYYSKLTGLKSAIASGNVADQRPVSERYKIIVPEAIKSFPAHNMCLSTLLKYSPRAMRRVKNLIKGRTAYIVPAVPHHDDLELADKLDIPLLGSDPEVTHLYSTKSGSKRIFSSAQVTTPPGDYDIYSLDQLHECLAQLITENLNVERWLLKLDTEFSGRGIAYVDVKHMRCYQWALKERERYGEKWKHKWAQENASMRILAEVPDLLKNHGTPANSTYPSWEIYIDAFLSQGGVVEATPPSDSTTNLTVDLFIEPTGNVKMVSCADQVHEENPFTAWGFSVPQSSVDPAVLNSLCEKIAEACQQRHITGYLSIDFVTFIDSSTEEQCIWCTDLSLGLSDSASMTNMMLFATNAKFDPAEHTVSTAPKPVVDSKKRKWRYNPEEEKPEVLSRYAVMSTQMWHTNLAVVHYSVFFQTCRAHGIGYDVTERQGTLFTLIDSFNRERTCMMVVGETLEAAFKQFARNLSVIHQEISTPNMPGKTNFKAAIKDIEDILGQAIDNIEDEKKND